MKSKAKHSKTEPKYNVRHFEKLLQKLKLGSDEATEFKQCLDAGTSGRPALLLRNKVDISFLPKSERPLPFELPDIVAVAEKSGAGKHSLHEGGQYYCLDLSSALAASALLQLKTKSEFPLVVDACASPGGKSILSSQWLRPQRLIANEVISHRCGALISNLKRCHVTESSVTSVDVRILNESLAQQAALVIVDAPCSGQSLLFEGGSAPGCFNPIVVNRCAQRQKRILADCAQIVQPGGALLYMTCTFAKEENEDVIEWILKKFPEFHPVEIQHMESRRSVSADFPCYRFWPHKGDGLGSFCCLLTREGNGDVSSSPSRELPIRWTYRA